MLRPLTVLACCLVVALWCSELRANAARPWDSGDALGEPLSSLAQLHITHETLQIDATAFEAAGEAHITASYRIRSSASEAVEVPLVFVSPAIEQGEVALDGERLAVVVRGVEELPPSWRSPEVTPDSLRRYLSYADPIERVLAFEARFSPGEHELSVRYRARPSIHHGDVLVAMQLAYVLAPARDWGSFGTLEVEVLSPAGWTLISAPKLQPASPGVWRQRFEGVPADALALTFRPPRPILRSAIPWLLFALGLMTCGWGGHRAGCALGRRASGCLPALLGGFAIAALGAALVTAAWYLGLFVRQLTLPTALTARDTDYSELAVAALAMLLGFALTAVAAAIGRSRTARRALAGA